jgi:DNA polymerase-3 subunit epsilon/ATP-dependent DNA helicase DinG
MTSLVSLDLETTGLDPARDAIMEIGAVRFHGDRVEDEFQTLVNPGRPVPPFVVQLTGINDAMLAGAPRLSQVLGDLQAFVGDLPVLGHNVGFDLGFLQQKGLFGLNQPLDTYDLASVLLPSAARYGLGSLAGQLGVPVGTTHRALDDARTTRLVMLRLLDQLAELPSWLVEEIARLGADIDWGAGWFFDHALDGRRGAESQPPNGASSQFPGLTRPGTEDGSLSPTEEPKTLDVEALAGVLEPGGPFAGRFPSYEHRSQQVSMLRAVAEALSDGRHLLVEAGTGTGKSMAYLVPALTWAAENGRRVVISTNTINLQDQLLLKDVPDLSQVLDQPFRAVALKGRGNYLCPRQLATLRRLGPRSPDEMRVLAKILVWLVSGGSGDRGEINLLRSGEKMAWSRLSAESDGCGMDTCLTEMGGICPFYKARHAAETAHLIIVNHALLLADIATGNRVIPEYDRLIVDEAHHLESATTNGLSFRVTENEVLRLLRDLGGQTSGLLGQLADMAKKQLPSNPSSEVVSAVDRVGSRAEDCAAGFQAFFAALNDFLAVRRDQHPIGPYGQQERILGSTRTLAEWADLEIAWDNLRHPFADLVDVLGRLEGDLVDLTDQGLAQAEDMALATRAVGRGLNEVYENLDHMVFDPDPMMIYWAEVRGSHARPSLHAAPLEVGHLVERYLWHEKEAVVMTSATLTAAGEFDYIRNRLSASDADELALGSPFDYETSTLLYLVNDIPEPNAGPAYQRAVEQGLIKICTATRGRTLALFTSYSQLRRTSEAISGPLAAAGVSVYEQGEGASRHALLETFRTSDQAVLLGTRSFWEGVDVPGEALSVLVIVRLPFDVPSDPIIAARSETYESPFYQYSVPEAILRFRQGFGRLIRTRSDRGVVVSFDRRLLSKSYGRAFVDSLPRCTVRTGTLSEVPKAAVRWLGD